MVNTASVCVLHVNPRFRYISKNVRAYNLISASATLSSLGTQEFNLFRFDFEAFVSRLYTTINNKRDTKSKDTRILWFYVNEFIV